jgi:hypothetical protein
MKTVPELQIELDKIESQVEREVDREVLADLRWVEEELHNSIVNHPDYLDHQKRVSRWQYKLKMRFFRYGTQLRHTTDSVFNRFRKRRVNTHG